ncbi:CAMK family protein kinase [Echinococcus multilocularis]|uniref:CAMK family protein kinase n=1 Tax=Echinococcus multilocularis TaxID=6211 RepID=A0A0S4MLU2_ECHMU|nr:CAMK family protein kinase [Echinococcus multilocularis]
MRLYDEVRCLPLHRKHSSSMPGNSHWSSLVLQNLYVVLGTIEHFYHRRVSQANRPPPPSPPPLPPAPSPPIEVEGLSGPSRNHLSHGSLLVSPVLTCALISPSGYLYVCALFHT